LFSPNQARFERWQRICAVSRLETNHALFASWRTQPTIGGNND
jgi:hypothetical protein